MLPTLGVEPALGRNFTADDDEPSANPTVLLSWGLWKRRFGGDPSIIDRTVLLDAKAYTVIGVMPASFAYPEAAIQLWTPVYYKVPAKEINAIDVHDFQVIGRLKPGVTEHQAADGAHADNASPSQSAFGRSVCERGREYPSFAHFAGGRCEDATLRACWQRRAACC